MKKGLKLFTVGLIFLLGFSNVLADEVQIKNVDIKKDLDALTIEFSKLKNGDEYILAINKKIKTMDEETIVKLLNNLQKLEGQKYNKDIKLLLDFIEKTAIDYYYEIFEILDAQDLTDNLKSGLDLSNFDTSVNIGDDFYQYANGTWLEKNPIPLDRSRYASFDVLYENSIEQMEILVLEMASNENEKGSIEQKIGDLYNLYVDVDRLNKEGFSPLNEDLAKINSIKSKDDFSKVIPELSLYGASPYFDTYANLDPTDSSMVILDFYQGGLGMGLRDYYLEDDESSTRIREEYKKYIIEMFKLRGDTEDEAKIKMEAIMRIENRIAEVSYDNVKLRDPYATYNMMTIGELQNLVPQINWKEFLRVLGLEDITELNVSQKEVLVEIGNILETETLQDNITYLEWCLMNFAAKYLSDTTYNLYFDFYGKAIGGMEEPKIRQKRATESINNLLGEALGQMYVKKYFPKEAKERMIKLVDNLKIAFAERINDSTWMTEETKELALSKLNDMKVKIGYPDKWTDYSGLEINSSYSYYENARNINKFLNWDDFSQVGKPYDTSKWLMSPQTVNAYYLPSMNEICFPAGILQYPFFDLEADDAYNYGAIGMIIGHEMTHGFDDAGRQYDKDGNLNDWWTEKDVEEFNERIKVMSDFFSNIEVAPSVFANGEFTLGENIADNGGIQIALGALKHSLKEKPLSDKDGFTPEQRFFLAYAGIWRENIRQEQILSQTKSDPHALGKYRVNAQLPHVDEWYEVFDINEDDEMYIPKEERAKIW